MSRKKFYSKIQDQGNTRSLERKKQLGRFGTTFQFSPSTNKQMEREFLNGAEDVFGGKKDTEVRK